MKIQYTDYLHGSKDSNIDRLHELEMEHTFKLNTDKEYKFIYTNYEVKLTMELDTETGKATIIAVDDRKVEEKK